VSSEPGAGQILAQTEETRASTALQAEKDAHALTKQLDTATLEAAKAELKREIEKESEKYQRRAQLIDRRIVGQDFLDVSRFKPIPMIEDPTDKTHFQSDYFWAHNDPAVWRYEARSFLNVYQDWFGDKFQRVPALKAKMDASAEALKLPIHLWRGTEHIEVQDHTFLQRMYPFIIVQRLPKPTESNFDMPTKILFEFLQWLDSFERSDDKTSFKVTQMQSASGILYLRGYFTFRDIKINNEKCSAFYLMRELIFVPTEESMYTITTGIPNKVLAKGLPYLGHLTSWLNDFQLVPP
jgi:hypothetical protein